MFFIIKEEKENFYIPPTMKERKNFILWKLETDDKGRERKIPYSPLYGGNASTTNPDTWTTYEKAMEALKTGEYDGIGYVLDKGIILTIAGRQTAV